MGTYNFRVVTSWENNIVSPVVTTYFNINFNPGVSSTDISKYNSELQQWTQNPDNILSVYKEFLKNNPSWIMGYITNWGYGWQLTLSNQNINSVLDNWSLTTNSQHQVVLSADIKTNLAMAAYGRNGIQNYGSEDKIYWGLPLFTESNKYETISSNVNSLGYSYLNFKLNFTSFNNTSTFSWSIIDKKTSKVVDHVNYNLTVLPSSVAQSLVLTHYSANSIPQYVNNLNSLSNKANQ